MASRAALYVMPSFAVLATAALVLGPGRERAAVGARVWGVPAEGAERVAWRLETMERQFGADRALAVEGMELVALRAGEPIGTWSGSSDAEGVVEAKVELGRGEKLGGQVELRITSRGASLAAGVVELRAGAPVAIERRAVKGTSACAPEAACVAAVTPSFSVAIERGVLAAPFVGTVRAQLATAGEAFSGWAVRASASGAGVDPASTGLRTDDRGEVAVRITPAFHSVELKLEATAPEGDPPRKVTWEGELPVVPGALWLDAGPERLVVLSPVPRERAYVSGLDSGGRRTFGAVVPLVKNAAGLFEGAVSPSEVAAAHVSVLTVAGDAHEQGPGTITVPLQSTEAVTAAPRVEVLLDGVPYAERLEQKRAGSVRLAAVAVALAAAIFEVVLLVLYSRASQAALAAHLARAAEGAGDEERAAAARIAATPASRALWLVAAVGLVLLAFGALATFAIIR